MFERECVCASERDQEKDQEVVYMGVQEEAQKRAQMRVVKEQSLGGAKQARGLLKKILF